MLSLGIPFWQVAHGFCMITSILLAMTGFVGFVMTGMLLDLNGSGLVVLAWATCGVGALSVAIDGAIIVSLYTLNRSNVTQSYNMKYTGKKLTILGGAAVNIGLVGVFVMGITAADGIAAGSKHTSVHPGGTKFMAILCVLAKLLTIVVDAHLLVGESRRHRRFEMLLQEDQEPGFEDEPLDSFTDAEVIGPIYTNVDNDPQTT